MTLLANSSLYAARFEKRGRQYMELVRCPLDQGKLVYVDNDTYVCEDNPTHLYQQHNGILYLLTAEKRDQFEKQSLEQTALYQSQGKTPPSPEDFKSLPQFSLNGWELGYWQQRAYGTAALWRILERIRLAQGKQPIGDHLGNVLDFTDGMGWLGYSLDVAGYTTIVVGQDNGVFGLNAYPYARYLRILADFIALPLPAKHFDMVIFSFSLSDVDNGEQVLKNAIQLLTPTGYLVVMIDNLSARSVPLTKLVENVLKSEGLHVEREHIRPMSRGFIRRFIERVSGHIPQMPALIIGKQMG